MRLNTVSKETLVGTITDHTAADAHIMTDEHAGYKSVSKIRKHESVNHIKEEWVRGNVHTNTIENYWSLFKRGLMGSFHQVSVKHFAALHGRIRLPLQQPQKHRHFHKDHCSDVRSGTAAILVAYRHEASGAP
jgi:hypothetical protein